jgi:hypothetical protein
MAMISENTLSLLRSRGVSMPRSQFQARSFPIKGSSLAYSSKLSVKTVFRLMAYGFRVIEISHHTSWISLCKDWSSGRIIYVSRRGTVRFCRGNFSGFMLEL